MSKANIRVRLSLVTAYQIRYEVHERNGGRAWAVVKIGIRGGVRHVATYPGTDKAVAEDVARTLNGWADREL